MLKLCVLLLIFSSNVNSCKEQQRTALYLDIAAEMIDKAKFNSLNRETKEVEKCPEVKATDCADWYNKGYNKSGIYTIWPMNRLLGNKSLNVYCDMENNGGGWTVIQRRGNFGNPSDYFNKDWNSYKDGFGDLQSEFWLGNDNIFALTNQKFYSIRFDLQDEKLQKAYAEYSKFWIDDEYRKYNLHIFDYRGNADNGLEYHNNQNFTTMDQNNSKSTTNCAEKWGGGWWYTACGLDTCYKVCLNGLHKEGLPGIGWRSWREKESLIGTEMKIRPENFPTTNYNSSKI